jgi:hypothetical protein
MTLQAHITGRLQQQGAQTNIQIVFASNAQQHPAPLVVDDGGIVDLTPVQGA